jgi:hypothetical protein
MFARIIVTGLVALFLSSAPRLYSAGRTPTPQTTPTPQAHIRQPQSAHPPGVLRIFIEGDFSTAQRLRRELTDWARRIGTPVIFAEKDVEPYDLRILLTSDVGSGSGECSSSYSYLSCSSCSPPCTISSSPCSVTVTLHFVSALALTPGGRLQFTETGVGDAREAAITPLARKLAKRLSVLPYAKATPAK